MSKDNEQIQALVVPLRSTNLVVPQALVAEILPFPHVVETQSEPWFQGTFEWRGKTLPLISVDHLCNPTDEAGIVSRSRRVAVFNVVSQTQDVTHYGVIINSIPHPVTLGEDDIHAIPGGKACDWFAMYVQAAGVRAFIPDFSAIERKMGEVAVQRAVGGEAQASPH